MLGYFAKAKSSGAARRLAAATLPRIRTTLRKSGVVSTHSARLSASANGAQERRVG